MNFPIKVTHVFRLPDLAHGRKQKCQQTVIIIKVYPDHIVANVIGELAFEDEDANRWVRRILGLCDVISDCVVRIFPHGIEIVGSRDEAMTKRLLREYLDSTDEKSA
jgi:hypothetical protein